jgi:DNA-binding CsgD family transcriptional regulator
VTSGGERGGTELAAAPASLDLLERDGELAALEALIEGVGFPAARQLLVLEGPPGIGKTSLLIAARRFARDAGMQILGARGSELERTFSFGVVRQLFEPVLAHDERPELLAGAAALAAPVFEPARLSAEPPPPASLATLHGLYWLTANAAARTPLLVVIDDLHWCDRPSLRWLTYLLPRIEGLELAVVTGLRPGESGEDPALIAQIVSDPAAAIVKPAPLSEQGSFELVRNALSPDADDDFCARCHQITGGNPLLLRELLAAIAAEGVVPAAENVGSLDELAARAGSRAVTLRLSRLRPEATRFAQAVAILGDDVDLFQAASLAGLSEVDASQAVAELVRVDVVRPQPPLGFVHPLVQATVYETLSPLERSRGHAKAAELLTTAGADSERVAAQLLRVPPALIPSEAGGEVVEILRSAARNARCRGASESAVAYLGRALAEPPAEGDRAAVLLELAAAESLIRGEDAVAHLREAHELIDDPVAKAWAAFRLGRLLFFHRPDEAPGVYTEALELLGGADEELAGFLEAGLIAVALFEQRLYPDGLRRLERVRNLPDSITVSERWLLSLLAYNDARANVPAQEVTALARRVLADRPPLPGEPSAGPWLVVAVVLTLADADDALAIYDVLLADARREGSMLDIALGQLFRAETFLNRGDLADAEAEAREARDTFEAWGTTPRFLAVIATFLARTLMEQGRLDEVADVFERATASSESSMLHLFDLSHAELRMVQGDRAGGLEATLDAGRRFESVGGRNPAYMPWRSQAALALLELGDADEARLFAFEELELARQWGAPRALGAALRVCGLVEGGETGLRLLEEAVEVLEGSPAKLEQAKARTELGAALRRGNQRAKAREHLRRAVELATICGAAPLLARAETELLATGARPRRIALSGLESLTPSERRVAEMAAEGPTNREIAQALFVTPKTVEVHLSSVYRKLGISSRGQLSGALAGTAPA